MWSGWRFGFHRNEPVSHRFHINLFKSIVFQMNERDNLVRLTMSLCFTWLEFKQRHQSINTWTERKLCALSRALRIFESHCFWSLNSSYHFRIGLCLECVDSAKTGCKAFVCRSARFPRLTETICCDSMTTMKRKTDNWDFGQFNEISAKKRDNCISGCIVLFHFHSIVKFIFPFFFSFTNLSSSMLCLREQCGFRFDFFLLFSPFDHKQDFHS